MGQFLHKHNTDNVHSRAVIVGLINLLNSRVHYENILGDNSIEIVGVPFIYAMSGDERFLQDFFTHWNDCVHPRMADGNYDVIPRGSVTLTSNTINTEMMTHRFVRGTYVKEVNGQLQRFSAFLNSLPLTMSFDIEIETDTVLDAFKIQQSVIETFYKVQVFSVNFRGFRVPCQAGFSEDLGIEKTFEFSYQDQGKVKIKFQVEVETYYPVTDPTTERNDNNRMKSFGVNGQLPSSYNPDVPLPFESQSTDSSFESWRAEMENNGYTGEQGSPAAINPNRSLNTSAESIGARIYPAREKNKPKGTISIITPVANDTFFSTGTVPISWVNTGILTAVNIYYQIVGTDVWIPIIKNLRNGGFFDWVVPFFDQSGSEQTTDNLEANIISSTGMDARIRAIIDSAGGVENIIIFDSGIGYENSDTIQVSPISRPFETPLTVTNPVIQTGITGDGEITEVIINDPGSGFLPTLSTDIIIKVEDAADSTIYDLLKKSGKFTGDIDNTTIIEDRSYINNINPTVNELLADGYLGIGLNLSGTGITDGSTITEIDEVNNRIKISQPVTSKETNELFLLSPIVAVLTIK